MVINAVVIRFLDPGAVPGASTIRSYVPPSVSDGVWSVWAADGGEIGSTGSLKGLLLPGMVPPTSGHSE